MHYAIVHIDDNENKIERRRDLEKYKISPILFSAKDHDGYDDKYAIVGIILERLYESYIDEISEGIYGSPDEEKIKQTYQAKTKTPMANVSDATPISNDIPLIDGIKISQIIKENPLRAFAYMLNTSNIGIAETSLGLFERSIPRELFLTKVVTALVSRGSSRAAAILLNSHNEIFSSEYSTEQKIEFAGALVSYCNRLDKEPEYLDLLSLSLQSILENASFIEQASIYNQLSRLYYGAYSTEGKTNHDYFSLALQYLGDAITTG